MKQVLVILTCLCVLNWTVFGSPSSSRKSCCNKYSTKLPLLNKIEKYEIQKNDGRCRTESVVFSVNCKRICANPADTKVKDIVKKLKEEESGRK